MARGCRESRVGRESTDDIAVIVWYDPECEGCPYLSSNNGISPTNATPRIRVFRTGTSETK